MAKPILSIHEMNTIVTVQVDEKKLFLDAVPGFRTEMIALVEKKYRNLIVDLSSVEVMNSSAIGVLILTSDRLQREGGKLVITGLCRLLEELFIRMRLDSLFPVAKTKEEAISLIEGHKKIPAT